MTSRVVYTVLVTYLCCLCLVNIQGRVVFRTEPSFPRVYHDAGPGTFVCTVKAYENSTGEPLVQYKLARLIDTSYFVISEDTGEISTSGVQIAKSIGEDYQLRVYGVLSGTTYDMAVTVTVARKNTFPPIFQRSSYTFYVQKGAQPPSAVGDVRASDQDLDDFNKNLEYSGRNSGPFWIEKSTGDILLNVPLPSTFRRLDFEVTVSDQGVPPLSSSAIITVLSTSLPASDDFCNSMTGGNGTVCWKVPDISESYTGFRFTYGRESVGDFNDISVSYDTIVGDEACVSPPPAIAGERYVFYIWTTNGTEESQRSRRGSFTARNNGDFLLVGANCSAFNVCNIVEPCAHGGDCLWRGELKFSCKCTDGWQGEKCLTPDPCSPNPCINSGDCIALSAEKYQCNCEHGFYGNVCQHRDLCLNTPCQNGGECFRTIDGLYSCNCTQTFVGNNCEEFDPCQSNPCKYDSTCFINTTSVNGFSCACDDGYSGTLCNTENQCITKPGYCRNGGTCEDQRNGYAVCFCSAAYTGKQCESFNACSLDICQNNSTCVFLPNNQYRCSCTGGYYGQECQHYNLCTDLPCLNGGSCTNTTSSFSCKCENGYSGKRCEVYDPCHDEPCERGGICNVISSDDFNCTCSPETFGKTCSYVNSCQLEFCKNGATCENTTLGGSFVCHCVAGFYGHYCSEYNPCVSSPCLNGGACVNISSVDFNCTCQEGYAGKTCSFNDPCISNPCFNNGRCNAVSSVKYSCSCHPGFSGPQCGVYDFCSTDPCGPGGECQLTFDTEAVAFAGDDDSPFKNVSNFFKCVCRRDYTGVLCETALGACLSAPCHQGATCHLSNEGFICTCPDRYTGTFCETKIPDPPCFSEPCLNGGQCNEEGMDFNCNCSLGFRGKTCEEKERCPVDVTEEASGMYAWSSTGYGILAYLPCYLGPPGKFAVRRCGALQGFVKWLAPDTSNCTSKGEGFATQQLEMLKSLTSDPSKMSPDDVADVTGKLEFVFEFSLKNRKIANALTEVVSNVMEVREDVLRISQARDRSSQRMVEMIDNFTSQAEIVSGENVTLVTENINVIAVERGEGDSELVFSPIFLNSTVQPNATIVLSPEVLQGNTSSSNRIEFAAFKSAKFFLDDSTNESTDTIVLSASITGKKITNLTEPIVINLPMNQANRNYTCKFWNETDNAWSTDGVVTAFSDRNFTQCHTYHLTSFAILMDPSPDFKIAAIHDTIQTYITYIGCGISMLGLAITIITFGMFRCLHGDKSGKILLHLCLSLLLLNIVFILGSQNASQYGRDICMAVAVLIHYFLLTSLMWMCMEAGNMYRVLVTVFTKYTSYFMLKRCIAAWGIPAVIVSITIAVSLSHYETQDEFCFISHANVTAFYVAVLAPACVIILINTVVFIMVSRVIMKPRFTGHINGTDTTLTAAQVRGAFAVMILLGVAWVFGPLAINEAKIVFSYIFCIANAFQGFLIFIFRCFINPEARAAWVQLIKTGTFKRKRGPTVPTTSSSASKGDSKVNGVLDDSRRNTMVLNENVWNSDKYIQRSFDDVSVNGRDKLNNHKDVNGHTNGRSNGHTNKHSNGHTNGHSKGHTNGHLNGHTNRHSNGVNANDDVKSRQKQNEFSKM